MRSIIGRTAIYLVSTIISAATIISILLTSAFPFFSLPPFVQAEASLVYGSEGTVIARLFDENREIVTLDKIPLFLVQAVVATEDARFYTHRGVDLLGIGRAILEDIKQRRLVQGASTITQQLARNLYNLPTKKSFLRKLEELRLALLLEKHYTKDDILELYLNEIYLGHGTYGVQAASRYYFAKEVSELNLPEAAMLAGIIRGPGLYSPRINLERATSRKAWVLDRMVAMGYLPKKEAEVAKDTPVPIPDRPEPREGGGYIRDMVLRQLSAVVPDGEALARRTGMRIYTSIDPIAQGAAERAMVRLGAERIDDSGIPQPQGALVAIDPRSGRITAWVGGRGTASPQFNRVVDALRSPGSAFKPFLYITALENGLTAAQRTVCDPTVFPLPTGEEWAPSDFGVKFHNRALTMREAIVLSCNLVASKTMARVTPEAVAATARRLGIQTPITPVLSLALGTSETTALNMASVFVPLANGGRSILPQTNNMVLRIEDNRGRPLWENNPALIPGVLDPRIAYILIDIMKGVLRPPGTGSVAGTIFTRPAAGKTGTSENNRDNWFVGFSPSLVAAVYVGSDDSQPMVKTGLATPIWAYFMEEVHRGLPIEDFERPPGIDEATICISSGLLVRTECPQEQHLTELFLTGTVPTMPCTVHEPVPSTDPWWHWFFPRSEDSPPPLEATSNGNFLQEEAPDLPPD